LEIIIPYLTWNLHWQTVTWKMKQEKITCMSEQLAATGEEGGSGIVTSSKSGGQVISGMGCSAQPSESIFSWLVDAFVGCVHCSALDPLLTPLIFSFFGFDDPPLLRRALCFASLVLQLLLLPSNSSNM